MTLMKNSKHTFKKNTIKDRFADANQVQLPSQQKSRINRALVPNQIQSQVELISMQTGGRNNLRGREPKKNKKREKLKLTRLGRRERRYEKERKRGKVKYRMKWQHEKRPRPSEQQKEQRRQTQRKN